MKGGEGKKECESLKALGQRRPTIMVAKGDMMIKDNSDECETKMKVLFNEGRMGYRRVFVPCLYHINLAKDL